jgi:hypothetical protein
MSHDEKREDPRLTRRERAYIQVLLDDGASVATETDDISRGGFRATLSCAVHDGSILHLVIELQSAQRRFLLAAEVRWCQPQADGNYRAGFALLDARGSDYDAWQQFADSVDHLRD